MGGGGVSIDFPNTSWQIFFYPSRLKINENMIETLGNFTKCLKNLPCDVIKRSGKENL